jgi:hypothetical protein
MLPRPFDNALSRKWRRRRAGSGAGALLLDRLTMKFPLSLPGPFGRSAS